MVKEELLYNVDYIISLIELFPTSDAQLQMIQLKIVFHEMNVI